MAIGSIASIVLSVFSCLTATTLLSPSSQAFQPDATTGIVLLAHGGRTEWNDHVKALAARVDDVMPVEVAFGMASRGALQSAIDRLVERRVARIVAVPLFVSSHSSVITSTEYLLGLRNEAPPALAVFARMDHATAGVHTTHVAGTDNTTPVVSPVPIRMSPALNSHRVVSDILQARARTISREPSTESVVIVAHGPVPDADNRRWLDDMAVVADRLRPSGFASVDYLTVRDDAPAAVRDAATRELRALVERRIEEGRRVLIVPLLLSFGGIEQGIRKRLDGLAYVMAPQGLAPDERLTAWVLEMAAQPAPSR